MRSHPQAAPKKKTRVRSKGRGGGGGGGEKGFSLAPGRFVACLRILSSWLALLNTEKERLLAGHLVTRYGIILLLSKRGSLLTLQANLPYKHLYNRNTSLL